MYIEHLYSKVSYLTEQYLYLQNNTYTGTRKGSDVHRASLLKGLVPYGTILILIEQYLYRYMERK